MRRSLAISTAAAAILLAGSAWAANDAPPSGDGASITFAPNAALTWEAGVLDPQFRSGTFAVFEPAGATIPFRFGDETLRGFGVLQFSYALDPYSPFSDQPSYRLRDVIVSAALSPDTNLVVAQGRDLSSLGVFGATNTSNGLFLSAAGSGSPYLALSDGGAYAGLTFQLAQGLQLRVGHAALGGESAAREGILANAALNALPQDLALRLAGGRSTNTSAVGLDWNFADWGTVGLTASHTSEERSLLGNTSISIADAAETAALSVSARVGFGDGWITTVAYNEGVTQLDLRSSGLATSPVSLKTRSYGVTFAKEGIFGADTVGLSLSRPLQTYDVDRGLLGGTGLSTVSLGYANGTPIVSDAPESDIEFGYVTSFLGGSLALQANAGYQLNANGQRGQNAVSVVSRAKINF